MALAADRFRVGLRNTARVIRLHPAGSLLPTALAGLLMTLFVLASVSGRMVQLPPGASGGLLPAGGSPAVIGAPVLVQESQAVGPASGSAAHGSHAGGQGQAPWSLVASTTRAKPSHQAPHRDWVTVVRDCEREQQCRRPTGSWTRVPTKTGDADWGDSQTTNADWGDAPTAP
jgi:hypothetical protein